MLLIVLDEKLHTKRNIGLPMPGINNNSTGTCHVACNKGCTFGPIKGRDLNLVKVTLDPVDMLPNPVNSQALGGRQPNVDDGLNVSHSCSP